MKKQKAKPRLGERVDKGKNKQGED